MELFQIMVLAAAASFGAAAIKKYTPETSAALAVSAGAVILISLLSKITPLISDINSYISIAGMDSTYGTVLIKTIGICFLCQFTADACRDAGQSSLASKVELASKISVIIIALPLFENILNVSVGLITNGDL